MRLHLFTLTLLAFGCQDEPSGDRLPIRGLPGATDAGPDLVADDAAPIPDAAPIDPATSLTVATYNLQNLFDGVDDPAVDEGEFTPSPGGWSAAMLATRTASLTRAFVAINADVVLVNEVENESVLRQLRDAIRAGGGPHYPFVGHNESRDPRGIDVGLLSRYPLTRVLGRPINREHRCQGEDGPVTLDGSWPEARPILQAEVDLDGDEIADLVLLGNHWKAKGRSFPCSDDEHRLRSALQLRALYDELVAEDEARPVLLLGDFNAYEFEPPLRDALDARLRWQEVATADLFNAWGDADVAPDRAANSNAWNDATNSSYNFRGDWSRLDHILLSGNLHPDDGRAAWTLVEGSVGSVAPAFLLDDDGHPRSFSFGDPQGFSDHLPVRVRLEKRN